MLNIVKTSLILLLTFLVPLLFTDLSKAGEKDQKDEDNKVLGVDFGNNNKSGNKGNDNPGGKDDNKSGNKGNDNPGGKDDNKSGNKGNDNPGGKDDNKSGKNDDDSSNNPGGGGGKDDDDSGSLPGGGGKGGGKGGGGGGTSAVPEPRYSASPGTRWRGHRHPQVNA